MKSQACDVALWDTMAAMSDDKPVKSAYELAMERLKKRDEEAGIVPQTLTDEQRAEIAEIRKVYQARLAEIEILHQSQLRSLQDPGERMALEEGYRRERERLAGERDSKISKVQQAD